MANVLYTRAFYQLCTAGLDFDNASHVVRCALERSTSTYSVNRDHDFMGDLSGFVEVSVSSYGRQTVSNKAVNIDDANDRVELDFDDIDFGNLESGQTVRALVFYQQTGGNDSSPNDDPLIAYIDTATGLPATLGGGKFEVVIDSEGFIQISQAA